MTGWWYFTRSAIAALTAPADTAATDRAVRDLAHDSRIGDALHAASRAVRRSWDNSRLRVWGTALSQVLTPDSPAQAFRVRGWIAVVAGVAALAFNAAKPVPVGPLSGLVPLLVIAAGALVMLMASPFARAAAARRSRHNLS
jgi:hypothetical protein